MCNAVKIVTLKAAEMHVPTFFCQVAVRALNE